MDADVYLWDSFAVSMVVDLVIFVFRWLYSVSLPTLCLSLVLFLFPLFNTIHKSKSYWNISSTPTTHNIQHSLQRAIKIVVFNWKNMALWMWCRYDLARMITFSPRPVSDCTRLHCRNSKPFAVFLDSVLGVCAQTSTSCHDVLLLIKGTALLFGTHPLGTVVTRIEHGVDFIFPICWTMSTVGASCANQSNGKMVKQPSNRENNAV